LVEVYLFTQSLLYNCIVTDLFVIHVQQLLSRIGLCLISVSLFGQPLTKYLACWFSLTLSKSTFVVKVIGQSSRSLGKLTGGKHFRLSVHVTGRDRGTFGGKADLN